LIVVVGILVLVNFLNFRHHKRSDFSEGQMHALSAQTLKVLNNLEQNIEVIGFFEDQAGSSQFQERVKEYHYVTGLVQYEAVNPLEDPGRVAQFDITRSGQVAVVGASKREILDDLTEEKLTNAIIKVTRDVEKVVYFLTGHGERSVSGAEREDFSVARDEIEKQNYRVEEYNLALENRLPEDASLIVSAGPRTSFLPNEVELLDQYLAAGGKFFLLVDPESDFSMNAQLEKYGVRLEDNFVVDATGLGQLFGFGAAAPIAADYTPHPITEDLHESMSIYPTARAVGSTESSLEYSATVLVRSSAQSWGETDLEADTVSFDEGIDQQGPVPLAVLATKEIKEVQDKEAAEAPTEESESEQTETLADEIIAADQAEEEKQTRESRLVLFGDVDYASNAYFGQSVNGDLFLNVISWLAEDTDLLSIRPKDPENRTLTLTGTESRLIFLATVVFFPLATVVFGIAVWYRRR
jgi:ABC-type uncharacterized transport system involved in gliding motility auxiliary subunit